MIIHAHTVDESTDKPIGATAADFSSIQGPPDVGHANLAAPDHLFQTLSSTATVAPMAADAQKDVRVRKRAGPRGVPGHLRTVASRQADE